MTREAMANIVRALYSSRVQGNLHSTMAHFSDNGVFTFNWRGSPRQDMAISHSGRAAVTAAIGSLIDAYRFENWTERSLVIEGNQAVLRWEADVTFAPTGAKAHFEVLDFFEFEDGKVSQLRQFTDTALVQAISGAE